MSIVLIGYRGSGKTTVGQLLARRLNLPFADSDQWLVSRAGRSIRQIFQEVGEEGFRDLEQQTIASLMRLPAQVIALGGGALIRQANRDATRAGPHDIVYLSCSPEELHRRIAGDPHTAINRPPLTPLAGSVAEIAALLARREPAWHDMMHCQVDVNSKSPDQVADAILEWLSARHPSSHPE